MHNPNATFPLPASAFSGVTQMRQVGDDLSIDFVGRKIFNQRSMTHPVAERAEVLRLIHNHLNPAHEPD